MKKVFQTVLLAFLSVSIFGSCKNKLKAPTVETIDAVNLKQGEVLLCGPPGKQFGTAEFENACSQKVKDDFYLGLALLHSFEYDEAEKAFAKVIREEPACAIAYW